MASGAHKKLGDIDEPVSLTTFTVRFPSDVTARFLGEGGRKKTALLRQIVVRAVRDNPGLVDEIEEEIEGEKRLRELGVTL